MNDIKKKKIKLFIGIVYLIISYVILYLMCKKLSFVNFSYDLLFLFSIFNGYVFCHFLFSIKKMYEYIYKYRYLLGIIILTILVIFKYNGSSIGMWNSYVQPEYQLKNDVVFGISRPIRSDEWLVSSPAHLTQATKQVNFSSINSVLSARDNKVSLYPNLPSKDISILSTPNNIGYLFLDTERAFSLSWYLPYFVLFFATFELFMILTKKNKLYSLVGTIMITFSPVIQWWQSPCIPAYGALAVTLFYYLINCSNKFKKFLLSIIFGYSGYIYIMCMYPAWQVVYAYVYLILLIWIISNNKEKIHKFDFLYLIPSILVIALPIFIIFKENYDVLTVVNSTVYPGARMSTGGGEWRTLFTYVLDIFFPFTKGFGNPCEYSQYLSLFPLPIIYSIYLMFKFKKKDLFLILSNTLLIVLLIWIMFPLPSIFSRITLIFMSTENRVQVAVGYLSIMEMVYILSNYELKIKEKKYFNIKNLCICLISVVLIFITIKISNGLIREVYPYYINLKLTILSLLIFTPIICLLLYNHRKTNFILSLLLIFVSLIGGIIIAPINKGLAVMYDKPVVKEINKLVNENPNSIFLITDSGIVLPNYFAVNGAKTINSTNQVPNLELYYKLDPNLRYDNIYNRYHHLSVNLTNDKTNFELIQDDAITLNLNYEDVCITKADYIVSIADNEIYNSRYQKIYNEYNLNIYKTNCNEN